MKNEFIPYKQALALKELDFDEPCFGYYWIHDKELVLNLNTPFQGYHKGFDGSISAPTFSQCFRWFREEYGLYHSIGLDNSLENDVNCDYQIINHNQSISELETDFKSYEEAELACLLELINICKKK